MGKSIEDKVLKRSPDGGFLMARIEAVHTHECPAWRMGKSHGSCKCGAQSLLNQYSIAQGPADPFSGIKPF